MEEDEEERPAKKGRNRGMNAQKKLALIQEYCKHTLEFRPTNKTAFWIIIHDLLKQRTGYLLKEPKNTVLRWVANCDNKLVAEEMGFGTQVNQDDFKAAVK